MNIERIQATHNFWVVSEEINTLQLVVKEAEFTFESKS